MKEKKPPYGKIDRFGRWVYAPPISLGFVVQAVIIMAIGILVLATVFKVDASDLESGCNALPFSVADGIDLSDVVMESYSVPYQGVRWNEIAQLVADAHGNDFKGGTKFYNFDGMWGVVNKFETDVYRIWAGEDWTVGNDNQLHFTKEAPSCYIVVPPEYEAVFALYPTCWYPTCD